MALNKDQLIFDITEIAESDSVGAFLRSSDGTLLTHETAGGKQALDVNIAAATGTLTTNPGAIQFDLDASIVTVHKDTATPANSRPLPVELTGTSGDINITAGDLHVQLEHVGANPDSVRVGDGTETANVSPNNDLQTTDIFNTDIATTNTPMTAVAAAIVTTGLTNRKYVEIQNLASNPVFIGKTGVTIGTGLKIAAKSSWSGRIGDGVALFGIRNATKTGDIRILEAS